MSATGFTPILIYASGTTGNVPSASNLTNTTNGSEIALNYFDGKLFYKNASNSVVTVPLLQSSSSQNGWLSSTDWTTFNNKQPAGTYVTSVTGTAPVVSSGGTTPAISMAAATSSVNGYLTSTDWSTFNGKQAALVSGTNIKTVSGASLLGSGDLGTIGTGYGGTGLTGFTAANNAIYSTSSSVLTAGTLPIAAGGTAKTSFTSNQIIYGSFSQSSNLTFDGTTLTTANDASINSLVVGKGGGNRSTGTAFGVLALNTNTSGDENTAIGYTALRNATTGFNTAVGSSAGASTSTGGVVAFGARALEYNTTGYANVAVGGYDTTTSYQAALRSNVSGYGNSAVGNGCLSNCTGSRNTAIGLLAGNNVTSGTDNLTLGYNTTTSSATVVNEIVIGNAITGKGANTAFIGGSSGAYNGANTTTWATTSDKNIKENIVKIENGLEIINQLCPVEFDYILTGKNDAGFIAQQYQSVLPKQVVTRPAIGKELQLSNQKELLVIQQNLVPYLVNAIQQLTKELNMLKIKLGER